MKSTVSIVFLFLISQSSTVYSLRILGLLPTPALSHFKFFQPILRSLADAGHDVTVYGSFPDKDAPSNYHHIDTSVPNDPDFKGFPLDVSRNKYAIITITLTSCRTKRVVQ